MSLDPATIPAINVNVQSGLAAIGQKANNINRSQLSDAYVLVKYKVLAWQGDAGLAHGAQNVLQQVNQDAHGNMDRHNAAAAADAMKTGQLSLVAG